MSRKKRKSNFDKLADAYKTINFLEGLLATFFTGELPRKASMNHLLMKQYHNKLEKQ